MPTQINNTASATYRYGENGSASATSNVASTSLLSQYQLSATKTAGITTFRPGENLPFVVQVKNSGTSPLYAVTLKDNLGAGNLNFVEGSAFVLRNNILTPIAPTVDENGLSVEVADELGAGGELSVLYTARVDENLSGDVDDIQNTATFTAQGVRGGALISDTPTVDATITREDYASIEMTKAVSSEQITAGVPFDYVITLENNGNTSATNVVVTDTLPDGFTINSITSVTGGTTTTFTTDDYSLDGGTNTLTLPSASSRLAITVPERGDAGGNTTTITINGQID